LVFFSVNAEKQPHNIEKAALIAISGCQITCAGDKPFANKCKRKDRTATFTGNIKKAVTGSGLPSYTSAAQRCPGNADNLKNKPVNKKKYTKL